MQTINISNAKRNLSRLVDRAAKGESFIIAKAGKPLVQVVPLDEPDYKPNRRLGFMARQIAVPDDFDRMKKQELIKAFRGRLKWDGD
ncbi:MAG TPA: type II toxin-antitoxin system prevent-host-death family antitoxin [Spongiibacteraceae bacterium]|nr:type II toxin-antitoxin system prevent-host-death family antitoxin [Spongiibacteraceae bacterium]